MKTFQLKILKFITDLFLRINLFTYYVFLCTAISFKKKTLNDMNKKKLYKRPMKEEKVASRLNEIVIFSRFLLVNLFLHAFHFSSNKADLEFNSATSKLYKLHGKQRVRLFVITWIACIQTQMT